MSAQQVIPTERLLPRGKHAQDVVRDQVSPEIIFGVVGHIGSGVSTIADALETALVGYKVQRIKAREVITEWAATAGTPLPEGSSKSARMTEQLQDRGDELRKSTGDHAAVAVAMVRKLRLARATMDGVTPQPGDPIEPSQEKRAFILDSIRHPAEAELLRAVYRSAFVLIGIVCEEDLRRERLVSKYEDAGISKATDLMARDAKAREKWGQRVSDAFHLSDYFIDNSEPRFREGEANAEWDVPDQLRRLIKLVTRDGVIAPTVAEQAMHAAFGAAMRSACLSRQVGAAIVNRSGAIIATGTNEVPRAGGGVYTSPAPDEDTADHRCAYTSLQDKKFCSNTREQVEIAKELRDELKKTLSEQAQLLEKENGKKAGDNANDIAKAVRALLDNEATGAAITTALRESRIGGLLEFSRAVHAEMDAIIAATRTGAFVIFEVEVSDKFSTEFKVDARAQERLLLKSVVPQMVPRFVFEEHPRFVEFLEAFCDFVETRYGGPAADTPGPYHILKTLRDLPDLDRTLSTFLIHVKNSVGTDLPDVVAQDVRSLLKNSGEFYRSKGTEDSFRFFFRSVFNAFSDVYLPKVDVLRASDGRWYVPYQLRLRRVDTLGLVSNSDLQALKDARATGQTSGATAFCGETVLNTVIGDEFDTTLYDWLELVSRKGRFAPGETVEFELADGRRRTYFISLVGGVQEAPGRWLTDDGHLSSRKRIQDSDYWQDFSYEIRSNLSISNIVNPIFRALHPAGLKLFARVKEENPTVVDGYPEGYDFFAYRFLVLHLWNWSDLGVPNTVNPEDQDGDNLSLRITFRPFVQYHLDWGTWVDEREESSEFDSMESGSADLSATSVSPRDPSHQVHAVFGSRRIRSSDEWYDPDTDGPFTTFNLSQCAGGRALFTLDPAILDLLDESSSAVKDKACVVRLPYPDLAPETAVLPLGTTTYTTSVDFTESASAAVLVFVNGRKAPRNNSAVSGKVRATFDHELGQISQEDGEPFVVEAIGYGPSSLKAFAVLDLPSGSTEATLPFESLTHDTVAFASWRCLVPGSDYFVEGDRITLVRPTTGNLEVYAFHPGVCRQEVPQQVLTDGNTTTLITPPTDAVFDSYGGRCSVYKDSTNAWASGSRTTNNFQYWMGLSESDATSGSGKIAVLSRPNILVAESAVRFATAFDIGGTSADLVFDEGIYCVDSASWTSGSGGVTLSDAVVLARVIDAAKSRWAWGFTLKLKDWGTTTRTGVVVASFGNPDATGAGKSLIVTVNYDGTLRKYRFFYTFYNSGGGEVVTVADSLHAVDADAWYHHVVTVDTSLGDESFVRVIRNQTEVGNFTDPDAATVNGLVGSGQSIWLGHRVGQANVPPVRIGPSWFYLDSSATPLPSDDFFKEVSRSCLLGDSKPPYFV